MPMHDWTKVEDGIYHDFHHLWISEIKRALNQDLLSSDYYAIVERVADDSSPAVRTLEELNIKTQTIAKISSKNQLAIRDASEDRVVAVIDILLPRDQCNPSLGASYLLKVVECLHRKVHVLVIKPFPPIPIFTSYEAIEKDDRTLVESILVGDTLPEMPLFLTREKTVMVPLEQTYMAAWDYFPKRWRKVITGGNL